MDFEYHYSKEQEDFRQEVKSWLSDNIPEEMKAPVDLKDLSETQYWFWREKHKQLAQKGWLFPTYPTSYGGGGLSGEHETILEEEFHQARVVKSFNSSLIFGTLLVWGTEEQKQKFLTPLLKSESVSFQNFSEPQAGSDLASVQSRAVRDGDDWIISGHKIYPTGLGMPDYLWGPLVTDPDAPRHRNLGFFMIPYPSPGLELKRMTLLNGQLEWAVFMDNVRVPGDHLIGGDHQGWQVTQTTLEQEHGGRGQAFPKDEATENLISYVREHQKQPNAKDIVHQQTVQTYIDTRINTLLAQRNYWMYQTRREMSYHGSQGSMYAKSYKIRNADRARDVMAMHCLLDTRDPSAPFEGQPEAFQRLSLVGAHPGGTIEVQKVIIARRLGISRTKERAAPTPATATEFNS